jgi:transcriptional regulator GlxA family with amidase domain
MEALFVACDGSDDRERLYVAERLREEDIDVDVAHPSGEGGRTDTEPADAVGYDLVHVTGGDRDAEERSEAAEAVRRNAEEGALVTAAGEGVRVLVEAGVAGDRQVAATGDVADAVRDAGGRAYDEAVVVDAKVVTTVGGDALPGFGAEVVRKVRRARLKDL